MEEKAKDRAKDVAKDIKDAATDPAKPDHTPGARKGEEIKREEHSGSGRHDTGTSGAGRPAGTSDASDSTSINPSAEEPIDPDSPPMRAP